MFVRVRGRSMTPALQPGDMVWGRRPRVLQRGDVVLIEKPSSMLKRIIGLPRETIRQSAGRISINNVPLAEPYIPEMAYLEPKSDGSWSMDRDHYFVLGDARDDSLDSRTFGAVHRRDIAAVVTRRFWPLASYGKLLFIIFCLSAAASAARHPARPRIMVFAADNQLGPPIGTYIPGKAWIDSTNYYVAPDPGEVFTIFGVGGKLGEVTIQDARRTTPGTVPQAWSARVERGDTIREPYALAIQGSWPGTEVGAEELDLENPEAVKIASDYLKTQGLQVESPFLTQAFQIDLDRDGKPEILLCAHSDMTTLSTDQAGDVYAVALLFIRGHRKNKTIALASQTSHKPASQSVDDHEHYHGKRDFYRLISFHDITGDGRKEIVMYTAKDGATQIDVFTYSHRWVEKVLTAYKAHYN